MLAKSFNSLYFLVQGGGGPEVDKTVHLMHIDYVIHQTDMEMSEFKKKRSPGWLASYNSSLSL